MHLFFHKNFFYENVQAVITQNFKNILRTQPGWESVTTAFISLISFWEKYKER